MRGRKPLPSNIIDIRGGSKFTHRPPRSGEPKPPAIIPKCPKHLDQEARREWRRMAKDLGPLGLLTNLDKAIFASYCQAWSTWVNATLKVQEQGMIFMTPGKSRTLKDGTVEQTGGRFPMVNPYFPVINKANEQMVKALVEIGMSPSSRSRVKASEPPKEESKKERFFR